MRLVATRIEHHGILSAAAGHRPLPRVAAGGSMGNGLDIPGSQGPQQHADLAHPPGPTRPASRAP